MTMLSASLQKTDVRTHTDRDEQTGGNFLVAEVSARRRRELTSRDI